MSIKPNPHKTRRFEDDRGFFSETYNRRQYQELGIDIEFVQDNHSFSCGIWNKGDAFPSTASCPR